MRNELTIVVSGPTKSGKSTVVGIILDALRAHGLAVTGMGGNGESMAVANVSNLTKNMDELKIKGIHVDIEERVAYRYGQGPYHVRPYPELTFVMESPHVSLHSTPEVPR